MKATQDGAQAGKIPVPSWHDRGLPGETKPEMNDSELLQAWANRRDEAAFAELVRRHLGVVRASARRQVGASPLADDVAQAVFLVLARKAGSLGAKVVLSGWLFRTTCFVATRALRAEQRRTYHELVAAMQPITTDVADLPEHWKEVEPHLDAGLAALPAADRDAVLLRFFEGKPLRAVGEQLGVNEETAKKRVSRAVEKLRTWLAGQGVALTAGGLITLLTNLPGSAAPAELVGQIATAATANTAGAAAATLATGAVRDWWWAQVRPFLPWAAATLLLVTCGVLWLLPKSQTMAPTAAVAASPSGAELVLAPTTSAPSSATGAPAQPGPSKILLNVRSAADSRPLVAQVAASLWDDRGHLETLNLQTDMDGTLEVPATDPRLRSLILWISAPGHVPVSTTWKHHEFVAPVLTHQTRLEPGEMLTGVVQDESGQPVAQAQVQFTEPGMNLSERENIAYHRRLSLVTTDAQGRFHSDQLPVLRGNQSWMSYTVLHPDFVRARITLSGPKSLTTNHVVVLERGSRVTGRVVGPDDAPVPDAKVEEQDSYGGPERESVSAADGSFSVGPFSPGAVALKVIAVGFKNALLKVPVAAGAEDAILRLTPADASKTEWEQGMDAAQTVRLVGTVVDAESGEPLPQFSIRMNEERDTSGSLLGNGHEGRFDWPVRMAFHREFSLAADAYGYETATSDLRPVKDGTQTFEFRLQRGGWASGRVVNASGNPVAGAVVGLNGVGFGFIVSDIQTSSANEAPQAITDAEGLFSLRLKPNTESLSVVHEAGFAQVPIAQASRTTIVVKPWGSIEGVVLTGGQPVAGQRVLLQAFLPESDADLWPVSLNTTVTSDTQGRFRFDHVPPGPVALNRYYKFSPGTTGVLGIGPRLRVDVPAGGVVEMTLATTGRTLLGRLELSKPIAGYQWRRDLQSLEEIRTDLPPLKYGRPRQTPEYWEMVRANARREAQVRRFFPDIQPDGSFRLADVPAGTYTLHLRVSEPPTDPDHGSEHDVPHELGKLAVPVVVPEGDFNDPPLDLGIITIPVKEP